MSCKINDNEVDIVIAALRPDLTIFLEEWRPIFSRFHLIIVKEPHLEADLQIPHGFDHHVYTKSDIERVVGASPVDFSGYSCRYFGYLMSSKKYIISVDDDCLPARNAAGNPIDAITQHIINLQTPATPFYFNTLYDPFREGADFVRGYPFSLRTGVDCVLSSGLWLNEGNSRYVDAVLTVPLQSTIPVSGINIGFVREIMGPALVPPLRLKGEGKQWWEKMEDIWCGMCAKTVSDHLGFGVKMGLPYVWRNGSGNVCESLRGEGEEAKLGKEIMPFFQSMKLPATATTAGECVVAIARLVREGLGSVDPMFIPTAEAMEEWAKLWKRLDSH